MTETAIVGLVGGFVRPHRHRHEGAQRIALGLLTATYQHCAEAIGDRRQRNIIDGHLEPIAHPCHIFE